MLITHGIKAGLYFEYEGKHYVVDYEVGGTIDMVAGKWHYYPVIYSAALCAPSIPFSYEGVITVPETIYFPGADFEDDGRLLHADPIPSLEVTGCTQNAFEYCPGLIKVIFPEPRPQEGKLYGWGVSFKGCISLKTVENMDLSRILAHQFDLCSSLIDIDLSKTGGIEEFAFCGCSSLKDLKFRGPTIMKYAFGRCSGLETISFEISPVLHDEAFAESNKIKKVISKSKQPYAFDDNVFTQTVYENALLVVPEGSVETYKATNGWKNFYNIVEEGSEPSIDPAPSPGLDPSTDSQPYAVYNNNTLTFYCDNQRSSREGTTYELNVGEEEPGWYENQSNVNKVVFDSSFASARPTTGHEWFDDCISLTEIEGMEYLNTSEMTLMDEMFFSCSNLNSVDLIHFDTNKVTDMRAMFSGCSGLRSIDLSHFNTSNVESVGAMFYGCSGLTEIDLSNFDTSKARSINYIFRECTNLKEVTFGQQFVSNEYAWVEDEFKGCANIKTVKFTGDIPASINSKFFEGVGTAVAPATLVVPEQFKANYQAKFDGNMFYGGYFTLEGVVFKKGDLNGDGEVNNVDLVNVLTLIMNGKYETNADLNGDGVVNVADIVEEVNIINSGEGTGSGYFWLGNYYPTSRNFPTLNGKEVEGIVTTYTSLDDAMAKASRTYSAGEYAIVMYPLSWGVKDDLVFLDSANKKYYATKQKNLPDFPDYLYYESTDKIGANATITLSTEVAAKAAGATLSSSIIQ